MRHKVSSLLLLAVVVPALGDVVSWEGDSFPQEESWARSSFCTPCSWIDQGWLRQAFEVGECGPPPGGDRETYRRSIEVFNGTDRFFLEFRVESNGDRSEIPGGAPAVVAAANSFGIGYNVTVARDQVKFFRDADLPIWFFDVTPGLPHRYRIEFYAAWYVFYIDTHIADEGIPRGSFPSEDPRITWQGRSWYLPCENAWDYIRYGVIPIDASGDFDSDEDLDARDFYFVQECVSNSGPDRDAGPGCRFTDFDDDADVDLRDFAHFQNTFTGGD